MDDVTDWRETEHPGYLVNGVGQVRGQRGWILSPSATQRGHLSVMVAGGRRRYVHYLVCTAFHGPRPSDDHEVAHWNGDPADNRASNLRWATRSENSADAARHGTRRLKPQRGDDNGCARLTWAQVREMRMLAAAGAPTCSLAHQFGVGKNHVRQIVLGVRWKESPLAS